MIETISLYIWLIILFIIIYLLLMIYYRVTELAQIVKLAVKYRFDLSQEERDILSKLKTK